MLLISGIIVATKGMLSTIAERNADAQRCEAGVRHIAAGCRDQLIGEQLQQPAHFHAVHNYEEADKEKDGDPFDVAKGLMDIVCGLFRMVRPIVE